MHQLDLGLLLKDALSQRFFVIKQTFHLLILVLHSQPNYLRDVPIPGDKIEFGDLTIRFLVDEDLTNYMEIQNWIRGLGFPESPKEFFDLEKEGEEYGIIPTDGGGDNNLF